MQGKLVRNVSTPELKAWWAAVKEAARTAPNLTRKEKVMPDRTHIEVAVWKARTSLVEWGSDTKSVEAMSDEVALMTALTVAVRQELRYKAGLDWREPCA